MEVIIRITIKNFLVIFFSFLPRGVIHQLHNLHENSIMARETAQHCRNEENKEYPFNEKFPIKTSSPSS
jgi:hypothetical protein